ncbi:MAG TPA: TetR/AcrR family transcriptional regulator [Dokdonella sp.]
MTAKKTAPRPQRSDAQRNRERLVGIAKAAFASGETEIRLDEIARRAGLGIGTLYRHFPTRDALIEAVYRSGVEELTQAAERLAASRPPVEALRDWMHVLIDYVATKKLIAPALNSLVGGPSALYASSRKQIEDAIARLFERAVASGDVRADIDPMELIRPLAGLANIDADPGTCWASGAKRLVDILIAGARPEKPARPKRAGAARPATSPRRRGRGGG